MSLGIFGWRFYEFRKKMIGSVTAVPTVIVTGVKSAGKTSFLKSMETVEILQNPFEEHFVMYRSKMNHDNQFIEFDAESPDEVLNHIRKFKIKSIVYVFDLSPQSDDVDSQIALFEKMKFFFPKIQYFAIANKVEGGESKLQELKSKVEDDVIHESHWVDQYGGKIIEEELKDLRAMIESLDGTAAPVEEAPKPEGTTSPSSSENTTKL